MASVSYPVSNITAGVSTQEYSLRMDGQASDQSNVLNSPRYGLCKRPNSHYLSTFGTDGALSAPLMFPLVYGGSEKIYLGGGGVDPVTVSCTDGAKTTVCKFPSSSTVGNSAYLEYGMKAVGATYPTTLSYIRVGDVTFISNRTIQPAMETTTWQGYTSTSDKIRQGDDAGFLSVGAIKNDDVWSAWVQKIDPNVMAEYKITWTEDVSGTVSEYTDMVTRYKDSSTIFTNFANSAYDNVNALEDDAAANAPHLCAKMGYRVTATENAASDHMMQATSLTNCSYASSATDFLDGAWNGGVASVLGRYVNQEGDAPGTLTSVTAESSVANTKAKSNWKAGTELADYFGMAWKTVDSIVALPPISWKDHTLKVVDDDSNPFGFYMRYVVDDVLPETFSHAGTGGTSAWEEADTYPVFSPTTALARAGHWEEYCGVGVTSEIDSTTMPHMVVRRPDGSFAFMEARGSFVVNSADEGVKFEDSGNVLWFSGSFDGGFNESETVSPLVVGETLQFSSASVGLPPEITDGASYTIASKTYNSTWGGAAHWEYTLKDSAGAAVTIASDLNSTDCFATLTTYKNLKFSSRKAGDDDTNQLPDFFKNPIEGMFSYQDRLGIFTENEVTLSGTGNEFNFFRSTVRDLLDSDRLKVRPSQADNESIQQIIPYKTGLMAVTNRKQLMIYGQNGSLSPGTITVIEASSAETDINATPVVAGDSLYLAYTTANGGGMYEMYPESQTGFAMRDVSMQIPGYLPEGPRSLQASSKHNMLFWLDDGTGQNSVPKEQENLYVYTWDVSGPQKQQSAWSKWEFNSNNTHASLVGYKIHNMVCLGDRLYMLAETDACTTLEYIELDLTRPETGLDDTTEAAFGGILLDRLIPRASFTSISVGSGNTSIVVPYEIPTTADMNMDDDIVIVATDGSTTTYYTTGITVVNGAAGGGTPDKGSAQITLASTDLATDSDIQVWVGFKYTMSHTLGPFSTVIGDRAVRGRNVFVRGGRMTYSKLNTLAIATDASRTQTISAGGTASKSGEEFFAIHQHINDLSVTITNDTPWQSMIQGLTYDLNIQEGMNQPVWRSR